MEETELEAAELELERRILPALVAMTPRAGTPPLRTPNAASAMKRWRNSTMVLLLTTVVALTLLVKSLERSVLVEEWRGQDVSAKPVLCHRQENGHYRCK